MGIYKERIITRFYDTKKYKRKEYLRVFYAEGYRVLANKKLSRRKDCRSMGGDVQVSMNVPPKIMETVALSKIMHIQP